MKAWQFTDTHAPLELVELPDVAPGDGEVVVTVKAVGICHSDVGLFEDEKWLDQLSLPIVPGHETSGFVSEVGPGVQDFAVGDRVAVWTLGEYHGYRRDGGFAETLIAHTDSLVRIPDGVSFEQAVFAEPGMTAHSAVMITGQVTAGQDVAIIGIGGLGYIGLRIAVLAGANVVVAEANEAVWDLARDAGATRVVKDITELADQNVDVVVDFAGFGTTTRGALNVVSPGGRVVQVGMGRLEATIDTEQLITKGVSLVGNMGGPKDSMTAVLEGIAAGNITPTIHRTTFDGIPDGIGRLARREVAGRIVAVF
jgi:propanol-preferring alcohol dehydrogenase